MKTTPWILTAALALGLTPAVQAQYRGYNDGYNNSYGRWDGQRAYGLAHEVDQTATWIYRQASRNNRRPDRSEARALRALYQLDAAAAHFRDEVESYRQDPRHTANDFARLVTAYDNAVETLRWIEPRPYIDRGMDRIGDALVEMSPFYGRTYDRYHGRGRDWDRHDRYDRDRRDRDRDGRGYDRDRDRDRDDDSYRPPVR
jgi:hypothetical protein